MGRDLVEAVKTIHSDIESDYQITMFQFVTRQLSLVHYRAAFCTFAASASPAMLR